MEQEQKPSPPQPNNSGEQQHIRLACQACQRKKIKCDRLFPCGQCTRSNLQCVPSTRKPRARHAGKRAVDSELRTRISKLESLVESLSGDVGNQEPTPNSDEDDDEHPTQPDHRSSATSNYMGGNFFSSLTTEVQALKEALEDEQLDDVDTPDSPSTSSGPSNSAEYDLLICPPGAIYVMPGALAEPNAQTSETLCNIFCEYVDRQFKVFHTPTLRAFMIDGKPYLGHDHAAPCNKALRTVVWYAAVNTMSDTQCQMMFGTAKLDQLQQFKRMADVAFAQADLLVTNELAALQAFTTYIAAARMSEGSRRMWTLTALAVRIGRSIGLDYENVPRSPFLTELRRRLWSFIRFLDVYGSLDRGTQHLITTHSFDTPGGTNTNDSEFDEDSTTIPEKEGLTDMAYATLMYSALYYTLRLTLPENKSAGDTWQQRIEFAEDFEKKVRENFWKHCDQTDPFHRLILQVSRSMCASMKLRAIRPIYKHASSTPPRVDSPYVLKIAVECMRASEAIASDPGTAQYRWMVWVQWHALAVALAGLCSIRDTDLANEAWTQVEKAYARSARVVADNRNGMLWKPIEKLYRKASTFRDHGRSFSVSKDFSLPGRGQSMPALAPQFGSMMTPPPFNTLDPKLEVLSQQLEQKPMAANAQSIPGAMPTTGVLNSPMDVGIDTTLLRSPTDMNMTGMSNWNDIGNGDMSWMDFERMLEDLSNPTQVGARLGDFQQAAQQQQQIWPQNIPPGEDWGGVLHQNLM